MTLGVRVHRSVGWRWLLVFPRSSSVSSKEVTAVNYVHEADGRDMRDSAHTELAMFSAVVSSKLLELQIAAGARR